MTGIILVGGKSRRMGQDKAVMSVGGKKVFRRILDVFEPLFDEILIVTDKKGKFADYGYHEVVDLIPESGPMGGIYTGLFYAKSDKVFAASCDLPFLHSTPVTAIINEAQEYDIVVPEISGRLHPLHAVYSKRCMPYIIKRIENKERNITRFITETDELTVKKIQMTGLNQEDVWAQTVFNMNTLEEWQEANLKAVNSEQ
ncbi:MAG: molybdenum cofactor guanylyltransferase [Nitrospirae bacterium]|nr:molybdenum cofactor guanylyltransferase [Nitrospirota bacterium]